ncbi:MAG: diguanylate cyclase, partial [Spongiibacteraceae bacterium]
MNPEYPDNSPVLGDSAFLAGILQAIPEGVIVLDIVQYEVRYFSDNLLSRLGYDASERPDLAWLLERVHPDCGLTADYVRMKLALHAAGQIGDRPLILRQRDGNWRRFSARWLIVPAGHGVAAKTFALGLLRDVEEQLHTERELNLIAQVFANSLEGILITDPNGLIVRVNRAFTEVTGYDADEVIGKKPSLLRSGLDEETLFARISPRLDEGGHWQGELLNRRRDGTLFPASVSISAVRDGSGGIQGLITSFRDITESKSSEERIRHLAYYDPLTALPNRSLFNDRLQQEMQRAQRGNRLVALLFLDLDRFKEVNDSMGHGVGEQLLKQVADRLQQCVRADDTVARMGGDEFTIIIGDLPSRARAISAATSVSEKIMQALAQPFWLVGREVFLSTSIGIA